MEKINVVLVMLNENSLVTALEALNFHNVNLVAIVIEDGNDKFLNINEKKVPTVSFSAIKDTLDTSKNFVWLISGVVNGIGDFRKTKKFLINCGVPEENIIDFEVTSRTSVEWLANLRYTEEHDVNFFATGMEFTELGLDLRYIPQIKGVNLSSPNQDLRQAYLTARHVFGRAVPGAIKTVLIGLTPHAFCYEDNESFSAYQYMAILDAPAESTHELMLTHLVGENLKNFFDGVTSEKADLNLNAKKNKFTGEFSARAVIDWEDETDNLNVKFRQQVVEKNFQILKEYIKLCLKNGAKPVGVVFPFSSVARKNFSAETLSLFRLLIRRLEESYNFTCVDMFDQDIDCNYFFDAVHLNFKGAAYLSTSLGMELYKRDVLDLSTEDFCRMSYDYFYLLSNIFPKKNYNASIAEVLSVTARMISRKNKIKVGFVTDNAAMWCGDELYNYFAENERFEPTFFLCLQQYRSDMKTVLDDFNHSVEKFKSRGINVCGVSDLHAEIPKQDIIFFLRPYFGYYPEAFRLQALTAETLIVTLPYALIVAPIDNGFMDHTIYTISWKNFFETPQMLEDLNKYCSLGMPRGFFSGHPKTDIFFDNKKKLTFNWKSSRNKFKKIIWAPHWSIMGGIEFATFQWNYKFMYEFAKAHPEISWVVKPHPHLLHSAVDTEIFPSEEAFEEYLQAWNDLPNAQVVTGGYYQEIFATSDGMIQDCGSFVAEYQYVNKPMIFLTRDTQKFNDLGHGILNVSYLVDGQDLDGIAALMKKVFIDGKDPKASARKKFFDKNLNYFKQNGMTASKFIYKSIIDELS